MKKLLAMLLATMLLGGTMGLCACGQTLAQYKRAKIDELEQRLAERDADQYTAEQWNDICVLAETGKEQIDSATTKQEIDRIVCELQLNIEGTVPKTVGTLKDGAFFLAEDSWGLYVRNCAKELGKDENWIEETIQNGGEENSTGGLLPRSRFWSAVGDGKITVSREESRVYPLTGEGGVYSGLRAGDTLRLWCSGDDLYVLQNGQTWHFRYDSSYTIEPAHAQFEKPSDVYYTGGGSGQNYFFAQWNYRSEYGWFGAVAAVKREADTDFREVVCQFPYGNQFTVQLNAAGFSEGNNYVKIYHSGGPSVTKDKKVVIYNDSDCLTFIVRIAESISVEEIKN